MSLDTGTALSNFIVIDGNKCALAGKYALHPDANYSPLPVLRIEKESWRDTVTPTTAQSSILAAAHTFKWLYPRNPTVNVSRGGQGYLSNRLGVPYYTSLATSSVRLGFGSDDATHFAVSATVELCGIVGIDEV